MSCLRRSAAFLVHWLNSCDSLLSNLYYVYVDSVSYLKKYIYIFHCLKIYIYI